MNILELCAVPALGGLELYFHRCCVALRGRGHSILSVRLEGSRLEELGRRDGIPMEVITTGFKPLPIRGARELARLVSDNKIDIVHAHHADDIPLGALAKVFCRRPFKLVFTRQMPLPHKKKDPYHRWIFSKLDLYITVTEQLKRHALERIPMPPASIRRLYYGVPPPPPKDEEFLKTFLAISRPGDYNIGVFSRLEFQKGQHLVIEAVRRLRQLDIPAKLYLAGEVMYPKYQQSLLQQVANSGLEQHVAFVGFLSQPALAMMGMDVLVLPSRNEAFGLVVIEAMRCGIPVMGVNNGGVPEIIDHDKTGLLFEWDDVEQLTGQLADMFQNPVRRQTLAREGKRKADERFDSAQHFEKLESLFSELLQ